ncbi:pYEATS domain-containing protein [Sphingomonas sp. SAFR-052]|uniref:pYEATS domain-containing protein n=1 Tax=Sphingomonas sp. SAFR-052 TaxID=3436867 RepID=UPI003F7D9D49
MPRTDDAREDGWFANETERAIGAQVSFAGTSLVLLLVLGAILQAWSHFVGWAIITACCASLFGVMLGLLFGLPTTQRIELARTPDVTPVIAPPPPATPLSATPAGEATTVALGTAAPATTPVAPPAPAVIPYAESTSLEQVADWLTKIIIGITLTQFANWQETFRVLAIDVTANLNNSAPALAACRTRLTRALGSSEATDIVDRCGRLSGGAIPGGVLILTFALLGFLVAYLWMRRYFIIEMVVARDIAASVLRQREQIAASVLRARGQNEEQVQLVRLQASLEQARAEAAANLSAAQAKTDAAIAALETAQLAAQDEARVDVARGAGTLQLRNDDGDATDYAVGALTRAQQLLPSNGAAQGVCRRLIEIIHAAPPPYPDDPWREQFGQKMVDESANVRLSATVAALPSNPNCFEVTLMIGPLDLSRPMTLSGQKALFFLHPTFGRDPRSVAFGPDGRAVLPLIAYGAFTVGVLLEDGTRLELNLAEVDEAPELFRIN